MLDEDVAESHLHEHLCWARGALAWGHPSTLGSVALMAQLNHIIVWCVDRHRGADHVVDILGLDPPRDFAGQFSVVDLGNGVSLDYADWRHGDITPQHLAFLVSDDEFDTACGRIKDLGIQHWAEPSKRTSNAINHHDGGRGVYWNDPDGHLLELITRPYGAETEAFGG